MKKILLTITILGAFSIGLIKPMAMLRTDENDTPVSNEAQDSVMSITTVDDGNASNNEEIYYTTMSDENDQIYTTTSVEEDQIYTTTSGEELVETTADGIVKATNNENNNQLPTNILFGSVGALIGSLGTIFVISRKK